MTQAQIDAILAAADWATIATAIATSAAGVAVAIVAFAGARMVLRAFKLG